MKNLIKNTIYIAFILTVFITGCGESSNPMANIDMDNLVSLNQKSYASPDEENILEAELNKDGSLSGHGDYYNYYYVFYWRDGSGMTDPVASCKTKYIDFDFDMTWNEDDVLIKFKSDDGKTEKLTINYPDKTPVTQTMRQEINNEMKPEITAVEITGDCCGKIENKVTVQDVYKIQAYVSDTVGLIGSPIEISYSDEVSNVKLSFIYDDTQLRGVPEKNLIVLFNSNHDSNIDEVPFTFDRDTNRVNVPVSAEGIYMLDDAYVWYKTWNKSTAGYEYKADKSAYESDWEREHDTAEFMKMVDIEWVKKSDREFHVKTPEQLAGVVYYVNALSEGRSILISIESDIDLKGIDWLPMGWRGNESPALDIEGNGFTIKNMTIKQPDMTEVGFIGYARDLHVNNLKIENAHVEGRNDVGILCGVSQMTDVIENVSISGEIISDGDSCGAIIGSDDGKCYADCKAAVKLNGEDYPFFSSREKEESEYVAEEIFTLTLEDNYRIKRNEVEGYDDLGWLVIVNGKQALHRNADKELILDTKCIDIIEPKPYSKYEIYLTTGSISERISNIIEYQVPGDYDNTKLYYDYSEEDAGRELKSHIGVSGTYANMNTYGSRTCYVFCVVGATYADSKWYAVDAMTGECFSLVDNMKRIEPLD